MLERIRKGKDHNIMGSGTADVEGNEGQRKKSKLICTHSPARVCVKSGYFSPPSQHMYWGSCKLSRRVLGCRGCRGIPQAVAETVRGCCEGCHELWDFCLVWGIYEVSFIAVV